MSKNSSTAKKRNHKNHRLCQLILMLSVFVSVTAVSVLSVLHICHSDREISLYKGGYECRSEYTQSDDHAEYNCKAYQKAIRDF